MLFDDEFNVVKVSNEVETFPHEFGKTQKSESTSFADNKNPLRDEINETIASNDDHKPEEKEKKKQEQERQDKEQSDSSESNSSSSSSGSSSGASSASAGASAGGAVAGAGVAAIAGVFIAVSTLGGLVGIDLTGGDAEEDYGTVEVTHVVPWSNKVGTRLYLSGIEENQYVITIGQNGDVLTSYNLTEGKNEFYFTQLEEQTTYSLEVLNITKDNHKIYEGIVTTIAPDEMYPAIDFQPDLEEGTFEFLLAYNDRDEEFGGFTLNMTDADGGQKMRPLENISEYQTVVLNEEGDDFEFSFADSRGFDYSVSYAYGNERKETETFHVVFDSDKPVNKYTVTLRSGDSEDDDMEIILREGKSFTLPECPFTPPEGYKFKCWKKGYAEYNPGMKVISYITQDYEYTAVYVEETSIQSVEIDDNKINFMSSSHTLAITMAFTDPTYDLVRIKITFWNPYLDEREIEGHNIIAEFSPTNGTQNVTFYDNEYMSLASGEAIDYTIEYRLESGSEYQVFDERTITFEDMDGRVAHADDLAFTGIDYYASNDEYVFKWNVTYTDDFASEGGYYTNASFLLTPISGGSSTEVWPVQYMPASGESKSISSVDFTDLNFQTGVYNYVFKFIDLHGWEHEIYKGIIDMARYSSYCEDFNFGYYYYVVNDKTYLPFTALIGDGGGTYGEVEVTLIDNDSNQYHYIINTNRRGTQLLDVSDIPSGTLDSGNVDYLVYSNTTQSYIIQRTSLGTVYEYSGVVSGFEEGYLISTNVLKDSPSFEIGLLRCNGSEGTLSNPKLVICDYEDESVSYSIPMNLSDLPNGLSETTVQVPSDYEYTEELINLLQTRKVKVDFEYDCTSYGATDNVNITLCADCYFSVR